MSYGKSPTLVLNRVRGDLVARGATPGAKDVEAMLKVRVDGVVPETDGVYGKMPPKPFELLAKRLHFGEGEPLDPAADYRGFFGAFRRRFKRG